MTASALRVLIADDEAPARRKLRRLLEAMPSIEIVGEAANGEEAVECVASLAPDVVLLDVQMPLLDGFEVVATVGVERMPAVVFVTAFDEHALRAFDVRAIDYLLKPVAAERLAEAIERVRRRPLTPREALGALVASQPLRRILAQDADSAHLIAVDEIELARAERNYVALHTPRGVFRVRGTLASLVERLDPKTFLRVNRSDVVRFDAIREMQPWSHGDYRIVLGSGLALFWSRRYRAAARRTFEIG